MEDQKLYHYTLVSLFLIAPPTFISLQFLTAPYGKHLRSGWGPSLSPPLAWFLMEGPTLWLTIILFPYGRHSSNPQALILVAPFLLHYLHRTIIYPLRLSRRRRSTDAFPASIALTAFFFNILNAYIQSRSISHYAGYTPDLFFFLRLVLGSVLFLTGMKLNIRSDLVLVGLKGEGGGYKIPRGGLFDLVSCPNYLGEILEWLGWAVMTWSWAGLGFFLYTCANLVPRARANHAWYLQKFGEDYPRTRKAVIPFLY